MVSPPASLDRRAFLGTIAPLAPLALVKPDLVLDRLDRPHRVIDPRPGRLALVVGHTLARPGAYGVGLIGQHEYSFNTRLAVLITRQAREREIPVATFYRDEGGVEQAYADATEWGADAIVELHFNATKLRLDTIRGTETLSAGRNVLDSYLLASALHRTCVTVLERPVLFDRGVKPCSLRRFTELPVVITEPVFGNNWDDAKLLYDRREAYAASVLDGYLAFRESPRLPRSVPVESTELPPDLAA